MTSSQKDQVTLQRYNLHSARAMITKFRQNIYEEAKMFNLNVTDDAINVRHVTLKERYNFF